MDSIQEISLGRLMANVGRLQATRLDQLMEQIGLYRGQAILLMIIADHDGLTHSELAERLQISPAAATKVIQRLEKLKYLARRPDASDERISRVYLQEDGQAIIYKIRIVFREINQVIAAGISPEEQAVFRELLIRIHKNLQSMKVEPVVQSVLTEAS